MKQFKVFFSWQADLPGNKTKRFIEDSIVYAKTKLEGSVELIPDEATRNRFGSPDIMESVFNKIDDCDLFIADVSIVGNYNSTNELEDEEAEKKYCGLCKRNGHPDYTSSIELRKSRAVSFTLFLLALSLFRQLLLP